MEEKLISGSEILIRSLLEEKVDLLFGYPGGAIMPVFDTLYSYQDLLKQILTRHEQGATHAAQGYARVSGKTGVVIVTSGPAATNIITGVADAMIDSTPMVVITGQIVSSLLGTDAFQETDVVGITQPITKWSYQIRDAKDVAWVVARAFYIAGSGRPGPVVLDFTKDAQVGEAVYDYQPCRFIRSYIDVPKPEPQTIEEAAILIDQSSRPLALVGQGVILAEAEEEVKDFLEKGDIPFGATLLGLSAIASNHPLYQGMLGMHGHLAPILKTNECDLLIAIGMRFDDRVTGDLKRFAPQAKVIHFDIDPSEFNKNVKATVAIAGTIKETVPMVCQQIKKNSHPSWKQTFQALHQKEFDSVMKEEIMPQCGKIKMGEVVSMVSKATDSQAVVVTDVGQNQMMAARYSTFQQSRSMITSGGLGTMGFGLPAAIGAKIGAPERTVCLYCGDGGLQMTIQELGTIMQYQIGVKIILLNNNYLGMVRQWQELFYQKRYSSTPMLNPDYTQLAAAYSIPCQKVSQREKLQEAIEKMLQTEGAYLLEIEVEEKGMVYPMVPAGGTADQVMMG